MEGAISQLHSLSLRNGYTRPTTAANTLPRQHNKQWSAPSYSTAMHIKAASESGGSSTGEGEASPPLDASQHGNANQSQSSGSLRNKQPLNLSRLNGGGGDVVVAAATANNNNNELVTSVSSGNLPRLIHNIGYVPLLPQRQQPFPNGDLLMHPFLVPRSSPSAIPTPYPTNKMVQSCFNCGSTTHTGLNCSEASMEDVTRNAVYKLDYTEMPRPNLQPVNNNEPEPIIIDLTQDTTSSSSSSTSSIHGAK